MTVMTQVYSLAIVSMMCIRNHRQSPVSVKADQKNGFEKSSERNKLNCASRHACARCSPARHRRTNSVINALVALSFTFQWLASTVSAPAMRKARSKDITPSPFLTSPEPESHALKMTSPVPCRLRSDASNPVSTPSSVIAVVFSFA
jgi:hypothetical protein